MSATTRATLSVAIALDVGAQKEGAPPRGLAIDVTFDAPPGITVLFGPSGAGKSRTLGSIAGLVPPDRGRVALGDTVWFDGKDSIDLPIHLRRVAYLFQSLALFPHMTARENVAYGMVHETEAAVRRRRAGEMLERMHVAHVADRKPRSLSGGEAQRVALARAFAMRPRVMLLDEPFSALDAAVKTELLRVVKTQLAEERIPTILVTHQPEEAEILGERVVFLEKGRVTRTADHVDASLFRS
jgi:molybdate transport system ATP-binding protein